MFDLKFYRYLHYLTFFVENFQQNVEWREQIYPSYTYPRSVNDFTSTVKLKGLTADADYNIYLNAYFKYFNIL